MKTRARSDREKLDLRHSVNNTKLNGIVVLPPPPPVLATVSGPETPKKYNSPTNINNNNNVDDNINNSSPVRRQKNIAKNQDERMKLITKALNGYNDDLEKLFIATTWKTLIRNATKGTVEERKFKNEGKVMRLAKTIIGQIASNEYSQKVGQILSAPIITARRGRTSPTTSAERATKFILLASDFDKKQDDMIWKKAIGERLDNEEEDDSESSSALSNNEEEVAILPPPPIVENRCVMMELEVEGEKENASHSKRQTRNSIKAQQSPLRVKSSQQQPLDNCRGWLNGGKSKHNAMNYPTSSAQYSIFNDDYDYTTTNKPPTLEDHYEIKPATSRSPMFSSIGPEDEVIENDTPPPTPINGLDPEPPTIPKKRTRFNSNSRDSSDKSSALKFRATGGHITFRTMDIFTDSARGSRAISGDIGIMEKDNAFEFGSTSSTSTIVNEKDFHDDLPDLEPPDTGRDKENLPKSEQEILRDYPKPLSCPDLSFRMFEEIEEALSRPKKDKIVSSYGLTLMQEQLAVYNKSEWLEDANIDFYLEMIKHRNNRQDSTYPKVYIFQSYFYKLLDKRGYESVQGASGKDVQDNIFQYELVLIPIHSDHHWVLVVVDFAEKSMMCYDSMDHDNEKHLRIIAGYLKREWKELRLAKITNGNRQHPPPLFNSNLFSETDDQWDNYLGDGWNVKNLGAEDIPQQKNGRDCGVFCLQFAEYLSRRQSFDFEQKHTAYFRKRMLYETLKKSLLVS